ncbi:unnamed protein product [Phytophthora fragariaefolia]|uniref:Unnamed protein product n=1 Tax=Phytophthora fragariaefolia TaxID=1490495 RepID=A0A9W6YM54_9STRA|nr:unnamed protein product [Phytophthora fragariaefolia]
MLEKKTTPLHGVIHKVNTQNQNVNAQIQNSFEILYLFQYAFIRLILVGANSMAGTLWHGGNFVANTALVAASFSSNLAACQTPSTSSTHGRPVLTYAQPD